MTRRSSAGTAITSKCPRCSGPLITQLVGPTTALQVTADTAPLTPEQEAAVRTDRNRLTWCYRAPKHGAPRLTWRDRWHPTNCPHDHVADHACNGPPAARTAPPASTLF